MTRFARGFVPRFVIFRCSPSQSEKVISATLVFRRQGEGTCGRCGPHRPAPGSGWRAPRGIARRGRHRWRTPLGLESSKRVTSVGAKFELQLPCFGSRRSQRPVGIAPEGIAPLPAGGVIVEHERPGPGRRDPNAEALYVGVVGNPLPTLGRRKPLDNFVGELHGRPPSPYPYQIRTTMPVDGKKGTLDGKGWQRERLRRQGVAGEIREEALQRKEFGNRPGINF